jgi:hypothetical protein
MASDIAKLNNRLNAFNVSLDELEAQLEPLFSQTLPETVVSLETIQQAKLQVAIPYLVHGLTFGTLYSYMSVINSSELFCPTSVPEDARYRSQISSRCHRVGRLAGHKAYFLPCPMLMYTAGTSPPVL